MPKSRVTRRQLLIAAAPAVAAAPLAKLALAGTSEAATPPAHTGMAMDGMEHDGMGHAAMIGDEAPAPGDPGDLTALLYPPKSVPHKPGRVREYTLAAVDRPASIIALHEAWPAGVVHRTGADGLPTGNKTGNFSFFWAWAFSNEGFACVTSGADNDDAKSMERHMGGGNFAFADGHLKYMKREQTTRPINLSDPSQGNMWQWYKVPGAPENDGNADLRGDPDYANCPAYK